ncbi:MAG: glycoside hydrolase family 3 C-terminal domain-containing protein [Clostridia bacterium]|nr:glycoside hydrolase family 3 C-terminal domain-containing protein [Clostridia bacterium]
MKRYEDTALTAEERAEALVAEMTVEEAASQLRYDAPAIPRLGIPAYNWWNEALHGVARSGTATVFPQAIGLAAMFDTDTLKTAAEIVSTEARAKYNGYQKRGDTGIYKGLTFWSPNINIFRDPRWGRGHETYGEDPYLTAECGKAYVEGLQGNGPVLRAAACAKHFAVHSGPENMRHSFDAVIGKKDLYETYLPAFEALVRDAHVEGIMGAYNRVNGEPACASPALQEILREWGFDGYFVSDCGAISDFHAFHHITANAVDSAAIALKNGCDVNCGGCYAQILTAYEEGLVSEDDIRRACVHLMRTRIRLGMFDGGTEYDDIPYSVVACDDHKDIAWQCALESMVLLKNNGILPLDEEKISTIAVIGPNANSRTALEGNYMGTADRYITFLEGIQDRFPGRVITAPGAHLYKLRSENCNNDGDHDRLAEALEAAVCADVVIACVGLDASIEGEEGDASNEYAAGDKRSLLLPESQRVLLRALKETGKPLIVLCAAGSAINTEIDADALLHVWYPGQMGGEAAASILFGDFAPSGKLPVTFYEDTEKLPDFTDYSMKNRTYRYTQDNILYPFGYGLTYGTVLVKALSYENGIASVTVQNPGDVRCDDVIELYLHDNAPCAVPYYSLCGFARISLAPGQEKTVAVEIPTTAFLSVDEDGIRAVRGTQYTLYAGTHQPDAKSEALTGTKCLSFTINF